MSKILTQEQAMALSSAMYTLASVSADVRRVVLPGAIVEAESDGRIYIYNPKTDEFYRNRSEFEEAYDLNQF